MWAGEWTTPVKAKTSAPAPDHPASSAALSRRGLSAVTHTGSRERGVGLRQTLEQPWEERTVGSGDSPGTAWATPLEQRLVALARKLAVLSTATGAPAARVNSAQAACERGACARLAASKVAG